jgi:D-aminopeptidase
MPTNARWIPRSEPQPALRSRHPATSEATEEAIVNALLAATTMTGRDGATAYALPIARLRELFAKYGRQLKPAARP